MKRETEKALFTAGLVLPGAGPTAGSDAEITVPGVPELAFHLGTEPGGHGLCGRPAGLYIEA
ncbi:hypothetical protein QFZ23_002108 [Arthrobacter globiformis]|nr:hypothetical protein [Arthrobacter globiformis]